MILAIAVFLGVVAIIGCEMDMSVVLLVVIAVAVVGVMMSSGRRDNQAVENMLNWWAKDGKGHNE